jgi:2-polyprenyl-6-methoxyphenol hydroxylase-like FAD-dependent oxidoreductase
MTSRIEVDCAIAGGGPAGLMLGFLLARAGVSVLALEKHADFLRDFRGDTVHPSTLEVLHELGLVDSFLALPHQKVPRLSVRFGDTAFELADFSRLSTRCRFIAMAPQWDFLNFLAHEAKRFWHFELRMSTEATGLVREGNAVRGLRARSHEGEFEIAARLTVAADGRHSTIRRAAGLEAEDFGAPMDVFWFRLSRRSDDREESAGRFGAGRILVTIDRGDYWQCAFVIAKGGSAAVRAKGLEAFRANVAAMAPFLAARTAELTDWEQVKLLTVKVDRLRQWCVPGLLCIGDAAHAMSPIGGVGVNLAIQDAVAAANILAESLRVGVPGEGLLLAVQRRRDWPTRITQRIQLALQNSLIAPALGGATPRPPLAVRLFDRFPLWRGIPARLIGLGVRPEHVKSPARPRTSAPA